MAIESTGLDLSVVTANADLSASQFCGVIVATNDFGVSLATVGTAPILGILQNKPTAGQAADVRFSGVSKAIAGAAYTRGTYLMVNGSGQLITATSTNVAVAYALESATAASDVRTVLLLNGGKQP